MTETERELDLQVGELESEIKKLIKRIDDLEKENEMLRDVARNLERQVYRGTTM